MNFALKYPWTFSDCISMSGAFDIHQFIGQLLRRRTAISTARRITCKGWPTTHMLERYRNNSRLVLATSEWDPCLDENWRMARVSWVAKNVPHWMDVWGAGIKHDWPYLAGDGSQVFRLRKLRQAKAMRKIGIIYGMEKHVPPALVDRINSVEVSKMYAAEHMSTSARSSMAEPSGYRVIVDRISHDIPFLSRVSQERRAERNDLSSTTLSGGAPTISFSTTRWRPRSAWRFRAR